MMRQSYLIHALLFLGVNFFSLGLPAQPPDISKTFSFAVLGDTPYSERESYWAREVLKDIDREDLQFVLHVGDIKGGQEPCTDELLKERRDLLSATRHALVLLPGDNDWTDCHRRSAGDFDPMERLEKLRELLYADDQTLGGSPFKVQRQSEIAKFRPYRENMRWEIGNVLFVSLNVPGSNNNYLTGAGRNGDFEERLIANEFWLQRAFAYAKKRQLAGVVVAFQANPLFEGIANPITKITTRDGFLELRQWLVQQTENFKGQVLLIHGDTHTYRFNRPLQVGSGRGKIVSNLARLESFGSPSALSWIKVMVDPTKPELFSIETRQLMQGAPSN